MPISVEVNQAVCFKNDAPVDKIYSGASEGGRWKVAIKRLVKYFFAATASVESNSQPKPCAQKASESNELGRLKAMRIQFERSQESSEEVNWSQIGRRNSSRLAERLGPLVKSRLRFAETKTDKTDKMGKVESMFN